MAEEGGPYDDGDSPPPPTRHGGDYGVQSGFDGYADRENGDRKRENIWMYQTSYRGSVLSCNPSVEHRQTLSHWPTSLPGQQHQSQKDFDYTRKLNWKGEPLRQGLSHVRYVLCSF
jgi:hypothetical protein